jgi:hypothetical protein
MERIFLLVLLLPFYLYARPVEFSGSFDAYAEYDTLYDMEQNRNSRTARLNFNPRLKIYGMPLSMDFLLSTEESSLRQELNKYRIFLNPSKLLREEVSLPSLAFSIAGIEIGKCYTSYSRLSLYGTPLTGAAIEMNPGPLYLALTGGRTQRAVAGSDTSEFSYSRTLYAGRLGFGKKEKSHLFFTLLHAEDNGNSVEPYFTDYNGDTIEPFTPNDNYVLGTEINIALFNGKLNLKSEVSGAQFTDDKRCPELTHAKVPSIITNSTHPNLTTSFDFAHSSEISVDLPVTCVSANYERIGTGYRTLGNEYLRNDEETFGLEASQAFMNGILDFDEGVGFSRDNLSGFNEYTTLFSEYRVGSGLTLPELPYIRTDYALYTSKEEENTQQNMISLSSGYYFEKSRLSFSPSIYYSLYNDENYTSNSLTFGQGVNLWLPLSFDAAIDWINTEGEEKSTLFGYSLSATYLSFSRWSNSIGFRITEEEDKNRRDLWYSSSLRMGVWGRIEFRAENNTYDSPEEDYNELRLVSSVSKNW